MTAKEKALEFIFNKSGLYMYTALCQGTINPHLWGVGGLFFYVFFIVSFFISRLNLFKL